MAGVTTRWLYTLEAKVKLEIESDEKTYCYPIDSQVLQYECALLWGLGRLVIICWGAQGYKWKWIQRSLQFNRSMLPCPQGCRDYLCRGDRLISWSYLLCHRKALFSCMEDEKAPDCHVMQVPRGIKVKILTWHILSKPRKDYGCKDTNFNFCRGMRSISINGFSVYAQTGVTSEFTTPSLVSYRKH